jgi:hypothetical protein
MASIPSQVRTLVGKKQNATLYLTVSKFARMTLYLLPFAPS